MQILIISPIEPKLVKKITLSCDIDEAITFCRIFERIIEIHNTTPFKTTTSNLMIQAMDIPASNVFLQKRIFLDKKLEDYLRKLCNNINIFNNRMATESVSMAQNYHFDFPYYDDFSLSFCDWGYNVDFSWYENQMNIIVADYNEFENYVKNLMLELKLLN